MSTYTSSLGLEEITPGDQAGLWGNTTNNNLALIDQAVTGVTPISFAALSGSTYTLTDYNGAVDEARSAVLNITGNATGSNTVVVPNKQKTYLVRNNTGQNVVFQTASPSATYTVEAGNSILIFSDGNNNVFTGIAAPSVGTLSVSAGGTGATGFGAGGFVKSSGGTNALTASASVALASDVSGTLPVTNGGTGQTTLSSGALLRGNGTSGVSSLVGSANGHVATWNGSEWISQAPASAGVTSFNSRTGVVTLFSADVTTALGYTPASLSGTNNFTGTNNYSSAASINMTGSAQGDQRIGVTAAGYSSGLSAVSIQLGQGGVGAIYNVGGAWDGSNGVGFLINTGAGNLQITSSNTLYTGAANAYKTGSSTAWIIASDSRIKKNVTPYTKGLTELNQIQIKNFEYNGLAGTKDGEKAVGVIADEIQKILPDTVRTNNIKLRPDDAERTNVKHFDNTELIYLLVNSVKELKAEVDSLKTQLAAK
jgi:hypothetical protein